ncbi:MAG: hypothetical protein LUE64_07330 [Candidatus Gastranaerophilales bacterium]|nr:hypothetical protein [Candidatus Gastranaerophilales bacterium]
MKTIEFFHAAFSFFSAALNGDFEAFKTVLNKLKGIALVYNFNIEGGKN